MARIGLTLYLMLATTAGPWLCCCTAGRLPVFAVKTTHKAPSNGGCCGHHDGCPDPSDTKQDQSPQSPPAPDTPCPCKSGHRAPTILSAPEDSSVAELGRSLTANPVEGVWLTVATSPQV